VTPGPARRHSGAENRPVRVRHFTGRGGGFLVGLGIADDAAQIFLERLRRFTVFPRLRIGF